MKFMNFIFGRVKIKIQLLQTTEMLMSQRNIFISSDNFGLQLQIEEMSTCPKQRMFATF